MIQITITSADGGTYTRLEQDNASALAYLADVTASQHWGANAVAEVSHTVTTPDITNPDGSVTPGTTTTVIDSPAVAATWTFSTVDITAQLATKAASDAAQAYLDSTDWVVTKMSEAELLGDAVADLLTKYQSILTARATARTQVIKPT